MTGIHTEVPNIHLEALGQANNVLFHYITELPLLISGRNKYELTVINLSFRKNVHEMSDCADSSVRNHDDRFLGSLRWQTGDGAPDEGAEELQQVAGHGEAAGAGHHPHPAGTPGQCPYCPW